MNYFLEGASQRISKVAQANEKSTILRVTMIKIEKATLCMCIYVLYAHVLLMLFVHFAIYQEKIHADASYYAMRIIYIQSQNWIDAKKLQNSTQVFAVLFCFFFFC